MPQAWACGGGARPSTAAQFPPCTSHSRSTDLGLVMSYMASVSARLHEQDGQVLCQVFASGPRCSVNATSDATQLSLHDMLHQLMHPFIIPQIAVCNVDAPWC